MLVVKYQRRIERLIGAHGPRRRPRARHRSGDLHPRLPRLAAVPRRQRVLHLAVPDRGQHRQEVADGAQARPARDRIGAREPATRTTTIRASRTSRATRTRPDAVLASKQIAAAVNFAVEALSEDLRQAITLREIEGLSYEEIAEADELPDRHRPLADLPGARSHRRPAAPPARHPRRRSLVSALRRVRTKLALGASSGE